MSTTAPAPDTTDVTTFRGRTLEELLPQIRDALGPDAVVVRQRDGLMGGVGGFFQQRFVEVDAKPGGPRIDVYDEEPAAPEPEPPAAPEPDAFAALLAEAAERGGPRVTVGPTDPDPRSSAEPASLDAHPAARALPLTAELTQAGMSASFAERLIADAEAHELPFARDMREAVRRALARRIPTPIPHRVGGLAVAFAGPGSTACADALARAYKAAGRDAHAVATLEKLRTRLERGNPDAVLALDLPPIATDRAEVDALAARVGALQLDELLAVLPADLDLPAARALLDRLQLLSPTALALFLDAQDAGFGATLQLACETRLPLAYVHETGTGIVPADPAKLAERLLP